MPADDPLIRDFLVEVKENLDRLEQALVALEQAPGDRTMLDQIFRSLHSTKGAAGFMQFARLERVAHTGENLLNAVREGAVAMDAGTTNVLLRALDTLRDVAASIERDGAEADVGTSQVLADMNALMQGASMAAPAASEHAAQAPAPTGSPRTEAAPARGDERESIRVDVRVLDELMDLVGELVLSRNQILQQTQTTAGELSQSAQQLDRITTDLQERVMKTRMQPIKQVWSKFPRIVRDLSVQLGKQVRLEMEGEETELDRTLIEAIKDPLTHLVRNAVDHGIEPPDERVAAGKPAEGRFVLRAYHESGQVVIEIEDDGKGIRVDRVKQKALEKGLLTPEQALAMTPKDAMRLIFRPGFSTAEKVTMVSGRGVGMDVVRSNIEKIGGTIEVDSKEGHGTRFRLQIPLTLAIIPALLVTCDGSRFAIPQVNVLELIRLRGEDVRKSIASVHGTLATRLRGQILPLVDLRELLRPQGAASVTAALLNREGAASWERTLNIVVLQAGPRKLGLLVDGIEESQEIVVKPLSLQLQDLRIYAGATILGDGSIALILDTTGVAIASQILGEREQAESEEDAKAAADAEAERVSVLLVQSGSEGRLAIPLHAVARLERFPAAKVERVGGRDVVQYRDHILRLLRLDELLPGESLAPPAREELEVVVFHGDGASMGLVVGRILDIVEIPRAPLKPATRGGVVGTAVVRERVTEFLDVERAVRAAKEASAVA